MANIKISTAYLLRTRREGPGASGPRSSEPQHRTRARVRLPGSIFFDLAPNRQTRCGDPRDQTQIRVGPPGSGHVGTMMYHDLDIYVQ